MQEDILPRVAKDAGVLGKIYRGPWYMEISAILKAEHPEIMPKDSLKIKKN